MSSYTISAAERSAIFEFPQVMLLIPAVALAAWFLITWWRESDHTDDQD